MKAIYILAILIIISGCKEKLDLKPTSSLVIPKTDKDFEAILQNPSIMNKSGGFPHASADEFTIPTMQDLNSFTFPVLPLVVTWQGNVLSGGRSGDDWELPYKQIFLSNNVIDMLNADDISNDEGKKRVKGWALFVRAYAYYMLATSFTKGYNEQTASEDLGVPLKLSAAITRLEKRSSVEQTYQQIIADAIASSELLQPNVINDKKNQPSKAAAFALLARVYLSMRKYDLAEVYADRTTSLFSTLTDFNSLPVRTTSSFTRNSEETIYWVEDSGSVFFQVNYPQAVNFDINRELYNSFETTDCRKDIYFRVNTSNNRIFIKGINNSSRTPFTGLASDEVYLIKAECLARRGLKDEALAKLNTLVKTRYKTGTYVNVVATTALEALDKILFERRKSLIWRSIRWTDIKRLNLEGRNITLTRKIDDKVYTLEPNSPRYLMQIPESEIQLSGIEQNIR